MKEQFKGILSNIKECFNPDVHIDTLIDKQRLEADIGVARLKGLLTEHVKNTDGLSSYELYKQGIEAAEESGEIEKFKNIRDLGDGYDPSYNHEAYIEHAKVNSITILKD